MVRAKMGTVMGWCI